MLKVALVDGHGSDSKIKINGEGEMGVVVHPHPPIDEVVAPLPFRQYMTDDGSSAGDEDMRVNGSSTNVEFCISARQDIDIYIKSIAVVIADAGAVLNEFGNISALSNGVEFSYITQSQGNLVIHEGLKTNFDFVQLGLGQPSFGTGSSSFRANNIIGNSEGFIPVIDFTETFGLQWGLRLRKGTTDKICFVIKDNVSNVDRFDAIGYGIQI
jgi:hypothetical protein